MNYAEEKKILQLIGHLDQTKRLVRRRDRGWLDNKEYFERLKRLYSRYLKSLDIDPYEPPLFGIPSDFGEEKTGIFIGHALEIASKKLFCRLKNMTENMVLFAGLTGSGKTYLACHIIAQIAHKCPERTIVIYDTKGDMAGILGNFLGPERLLEVSYKDYWRNYYQILEEGHDLDTISGANKSCLLCSGYIGSGPANIFQDILKKLCTPQALASRGGFPPSGEIMHAIKNLPRQYNDKYKESLINNYGNISVNLPNLNHSKGFTWRNFLGKVMIINLFGLTDPGALKYFINSEIKDLELFLAKNPNHGGFTILLDELRNFTPLKKEDGYVVPVLISAVKTLRWKGVNFFFGEQNPSQIDLEMFGNISTFFIFRTPDIQDRRRVCSATGLGFGYERLEQIEKIGKLQRRQCVVWYPDLEDAVLIETPEIKVKDMAEKVREWSEPIIREFHERFTHREKPCISKEEPISNKVIFPRDKQEIYRKILEHTLKNPLAGITEVYNFIGRDCSKEVKELVERGWLDGPVPIPVKKGPPKKAYIPTKEGAQVFGLDWRRYSLRGKGKGMSKIYSYIIYKRIKQSEGIPKIEYTLSNGIIKKLVDVYDEKDRIAYEIQTSTAHLLENLEKDLACGAEWVVVVVPTKTQAKRVEKFLERKMNPDLMHAVSVSPISDFINGGLDV